MNEWDKDVVLSAFIELQHLREQVKNNQIEIWELKEKRDALLEENKLLKGRLA